ncbi:Vacuolar protein sorting-associated protein 51, partial [Rhizoclosmatium sp. JEL0117]
MASPNRDTTSSLSTEAASVLDRAESTASLGSVSRVGGTGTGTGTRAKRSRLKDFYGLDATASSATDAPPSTISSAVSESPLSADSAPPSSVLGAPAQHKLKSLGPNPMDMDSPFFVPETFVSKCVNECTLPDLIQQDNDLVAEIKDLDASMKTLVYGNYNKFIAASDTIRAMRVKVDDMEAQMQLFSNKMNGIADDSARIHSFLGEKRARMKQLAGVHALLNKLHFVFELPAKLTTSLQQQKYREAVLLYAQTQNLLAHYKNLALFSKISQECSVTMDKVTQKLLVTLNGPNSSPADVTEAVWLLGTVGRGFSCANDLATSYLSVMKTQIHKRIDSTLHELVIMKRNSAASPSESGLDPIAQLAVQQIKLLNTNVLKPVSDFQIKFHDLFLAGREEEGTGFFGKNAEALTFEQRDRLERELENISEGFLTRYFDHVGKMVAVPEDIWVYSATSFIHIFDTISKDIVPMRGLTLFLNMTERVRVYAVDYIKKVSDLAFTTAKVLYMDELRKIETPNASAKTVLEDANTILKKTIVEKSFPLLEKFVDTKLSFVDASSFRIPGVVGNDNGVEAVLELLTECFEGFWNGLAEEMKIISGDTYSATPKPTPKLLLLIMSRSALSLSSTLIDSVYTSFTHTVLKSRNATIDSAAAKEALAAQTAAKRNKLIIVTAGGGT